jgi:hypothetical protein
MTQQHFELAADLYSNLTHGNLQDVREFFRTADKRTALLTLLEVLETAHAFDTNDNEHTAAGEAMRDFKLQVAAAL